MSLVIESVIAYLTELSGNDKEYVIVVAYEADSLTFVARVPGSSLATHGDTRGAAVGEMLDLLQAVSEDD